MNAKTPHLPTQERLLELLRYEPSTGRLFWKRKAGLTTYERWFNSRFADKEAFTAKTTDGYLRGYLDGKDLRAHRVVWKMLTGEEPPKLDHKNGIRSDNRKRNLRPVSNTDHARNFGRRTNNTSGVTGVYFLQREGKWAAQITVDYVSKRLGLFDDKQDAVRARRNAEREAGFFGGHGRREGFRK